MTPERKAALDYEVRMFIALRLRAYYDNILNNPVSEPLSEFERKTNQERQTTS